MSFTESHPDSCYNAKTNHCDCKCNGKLHGRKSGNLTERQKADINNLKVGDIVIVHGDVKTEGDKAFIEEIIRDPQPNLKGFLEYGKYSIYGFKRKYHDSASRYYGDYIGYQLEPVPEGHMTEMLLNDFAKEEPNNKGLQKDIETVIKNLGRNKKEIIS